MGHCPILTCIYSRRVQIENMNLSYENCPPHFNMMGERRNFNVFESIFLPQRQNHLPLFCAELLLRCPGMILTETGLPVLFPEKVQPWAEVRHISKLEASSMPGRSVFSSTMNESSPVEGTFAPWEAVSPLPVNVNRVYRSKNANFSIMKTFSD